MKDGDGAVSPLELAQKIVSCCSEAKARDMVALDVSKVFDLSTYFIIVTGRSDRQVQGISNRVMFTLAQYGIEPISRDGYDEGHWILMDYGDVVLHIFYEPIRDHFDLENLWRKATPVPLGTEEEERSTQAA